MQIIKRTLEGERYRLGPVIQLNDKKTTAAVPIISREESERNYVTLPEVEEDRVEYIDTGSIGRVKARGRDVFVRLGTVLEGKGTQSRIVTQSTVITGEKEVRTKCVHRSHPVSSGKGFRSVGIAPPNVENVVTAGGSQGQVWGATFDAASTVGMVEENLAAAMTISEPRTTESRAEPRPQSTGAEVEPAPRHLARDMEPVKAQNQVEEIMDVIEDIGGFEGQVGVIVVDSEGAKGMEAFDHPASWAAHYRDVLEKYVSTPVDTPLFEVNEEAVLNEVKRFLRSLLNPETRVVEDTETVVKKLKGSLHGECVDFREENIYVLARRDVEELRSSNSSTWSEWSEATNSTGDDLYASQTYSTNLYTGSDSDESLSSVTDAQLVSTATETRDQPSSHSSTGDEVKIGQLVNEFVSSRKGMDQVLNRSREGATFTDLKNSVDVSSATLAKRLKEAQKTGLLKRDVNGRDNRLKYFSTGLWEA